MSCKTQTAFQVRQTHVHFHYLPLVILAHLCYRFNMGHRAPSAASGYKKPTKELVFWLLAVQRRLLDVSPRTHGQCRCNLRHSQANIPSRTCKDCRLGGKLVEDSTSATPDRMFCSRPSPARVTFRSGVIRRPSVHCIFVSALRTARRRRAHAPPCKNAMTLAIRRRRPLNSAVPEFSAGETGNRKSSCCFFCSA